MHSRVNALVVLYFDGNWLSLQMLAISRLQPSGVSPEDVSLLASWDQLLKFSQVIGMDFPARMFVTGPANFYDHAIHREIVRPPHGAENHRKVVGRRRLLGVSGGWNKNRQQAAEKAWNQPGAPE